MRIFQKECRTLARAGYRVSLVAPGEDAENDGVRVLGVPRPRHRAERMALGAARVFRRAWAEKADLYHFHDPELLPWGRVLRAKGVPVVYDSHEYLSLDVSDKPWIPKPLAPGVGALSGWMERKIVRGLSGVVTVNPHMAGLFEPHAPRVCVVGNYPFRNLAELPSPTEREPHVVYVGGLSKVRGYELMHDAMARLPGTRCRVLGKLDATGLTLRESSSVEFLPSVPHGEVAAVVSRHAIGWLPWASSPGTEYGLPTKLFEYMALGLPVVVSDLPFVKTIVENSGGGIVVPRDRPEAHADAIRRLLENPVEARRMGERGRAAVRSELNWETQAESLLAFYRELLG